jgi:hypothetical protein
LDACGGRKGVGDGEIVWRLAAGRVAPHITTIQRYFLRHAMAANGTRDWGGWRTKSVGEKHR